jgi:hypothetical protein
MPARRDHSEQLLHSDVKQAVVLLRKFEASQSFTHPQTRQLQTSTLDRLCSALGLDYVAPQRRSSQQW